MARLLVLQSNRMTTFSVGSIVWREYTWPFVQSLHRLTQLAPMHGLLMLSGDALVSRARGIVATRFLKHETEDVLLFIDSDIFFDPRDAIKVCEQAHEIGGIVGGAYTVRKGNGSFPACMLRVGEPVTFYDPDGPDLVDVTYVSGGFMAISRKCLNHWADYFDGDNKALLHAGTNLEHYPFFLPREKDGLYLSEDWAFCDTMRYLNTPVKLNPKVRLRHIGPYGHHMEDMVTSYPENGIVKVTFDGTDYTAEMVA